MRQLTFILFLVFNLSVFGQPPTVAASNLTFNTIACNEILISWTNGNGNERVVFVRQSRDISSVPETDQFYTSDPIFKKGESIYNDTAHYCVYRGIANSITVKGLKKGTKYCVAVFELNSKPPSYEYLTSSYVTKCFTTYNIFANFGIVPTSQCLNGNTYNFYDSSTTNLPKPYSFTYKWSFGDAGFSTQSTAKNPTHQYTTPKIYSVKLITNAPGCTDTIYKNDTVNPHPVPYFDLDPTKPKHDSIQCFFNNRYTFRNSTTLLDIGIGKSSMSYEWKIDGVLFSNAYKSDIHVPTSGVFIIKLIATSYQGCKDSTTNVYKVLPRAIDSTKVVFNEKSMCLSGNEFIVTNNSPNSVVSKWTFGDTPLDNDTLYGKTTKHKYGKVGTYAIKLYALDNGGCIDIWHDSVTVFNNTNVSFSGLLNQYCQSNTAVRLFPTSGKGTFFGTGVNWTDSTYTPSVLGKDSVGYVTAKGNCRDTFLRYLEVFPNPVANIGKDTVICIDKPVLLKADPTYSNTWYTLGNSVGSSGPTFTVKTSGSYRVVSLLGNCTDSDTIIVKAISTPTITHTSDTTLCGGSYLKFNFKVDLGTAFWSDGSNLKDRNVTESGFYKVTLTNKCGSVSDSFNLKVEETACVVFFPNAFTPNGDLLNDVWQPFGKYTFLKMNIFNRWGERVYFSDKSPIWDGYLDKSPIWDGSSDKSLCLDGVYSIVFEYLMQDGNTTKRETKGLVVHLIR